mmetsp:Transcript_15253/g.22488  ORF Transcript_15253/g.22488 Transcript_15253/m.22488 type:complete len:486 (-) Transcript_15253:1703-3160(-)
MEQEKPKEEKKKRSAEEAVKELEKRLASLGGLAPAEDTNNKGSDLLNFSNANYPPAPEPPSTSSSQTKDVKGGKNALLARIMAAQEKVKETTAAAANPPAVNVASPLPPAFEEALPPTYDAGLLAPPLPPAQDAAPPPSFDAVENTVMSQVQPPNYFAAAPPPPRQAAAVTPSAPAFEDLLGDQQAPLPPPPPQLSPEEEMIMGMEGLSPEERKNLLDEQRKIMEQIEREKNANKAAIAAAEADNFNMRSTSAAVNAMNGRTGQPQTKPPGAETGSRVNLGSGKEVDLHGPERTKEAIKDGTAILVQCVNCENWMQVTGNATLMYCPVCAVVSPVDQNSAAMSKEEAMQMEADRKMAEKLQNEEYENADQTESSPRRVRQEAPKPPAGAESSWWNNMTGMFTTTDSTTAARSEERESLTNHRPAGVHGARVAEQKPLFSCVVDSVNTTVGTLTGTNLTEDGEGNVHGVDASSLLAVSNVGRENPN